MLPSNPAVYQISDINRYLRSSWMFPEARSANDELTDFEFGGILLQDPSRGLQYQVWKGYWNSSDSKAYLVPQDGEGTPIEIFTELNVIEFTFSFDQNMRWCAATRFTDKTMKFRWYDSVTEAYTVNTYTNIDSVRLTHDDKRDVQVNLGTSDVILTYLTANSLRWRVQRDRYLSEYAGPGVYPLSHRITNFGMNTKNRLQWRIGPRRINL